MSILCDKLNLIGITEIQNTGIFKIANTHSEIDKTRETGVHFHFLNLFTQDDIDPFLHNAIILQKPEMLFSV